LFRFFHILRVCLESVRRPINSFNNIWSNFGRWVFSLLNLIHCLSNYLFAWEDKLFWILLDLFVTEFKLLKRKFFYFVLIIGFILRRHRSWVVWGEFDVLHFFLGDFRLWNTIKFKPSNFTILGELCRLDSIRFLGFIYIFRDKKLRASRRTVAGLGRVLIKASTTVQSILIRAQSFGALIPLLRWIITTFTRRTCVWHKTEVFFGKLKLICA